VPSVDHDQRATWSIGTAALRRSYDGRKRGMQPSSRTRNALLVAIAMNIPLPKTICFIGGGVGMNVYVTHGSLCHSLSPSIRYVMMIPGSVVLNASRKHIQLVQSSLGLYVRMCHMPRTCQCCACNKHSGRQKTSRPLGSTF
jgi:hypothetical protein